MEKDRSCYKWLSTISATLMLFWGSVISSRMNALPTRDIVDGCINNNLCMSLSDEEINLIENLDMRDYRDFLDKVFSERNMMDFIDRYRGDKDLLDSTYFLSFIRFIKTHGSYRIGEELIKKLIALRTEYEKQWDKTVASEFDNWYGTNLMAFITNKSM